MMAVHITIFYNIATAPEIRVSAKVWKVKIKFPYGFHPTDNVTIAKSRNWVIYHVLN